MNKIRSIRPWQLPVPVMDPSKRATVTTSDDHGLWRFFNTNKEVLTDPKDLNAHGMFCARTEQGKNHRLLLINNAKGEHGQRKS